MGANLTHASRPRLGPLRKPALALAALIAMTAATLGLTAVPASAASWHYYQAYATSASCKAVGQFALASGKADKYKCLWDSPDFALYLYY